jgi:NAD(P)-dependent dehydrogenase (short-subunit alcohol dehydrogenase family)
MESEMQNRLVDNAIIVIGGGSGIGAGTARRLAAEGARLCIADINPESAERIAEQVRAAGGSAFALTVDIVEEASVNAAVNAAVEQLGRLDGAFINAADVRVIFQDSDALAEDLAVFDRTIAVNLRGHLLCTRAVLPHLLTRDRGAIVYTTSAAADIAEPERPAYASSKSGIHALMRHVASRWGKEGITANCVAPGAVMTPEAMAGGKVPPEYIEAALALVKNKRLGQVEDIAGVVAMLLSRDGLWINGQVFHINGGSFMR